jgi:hypothetical protein
MTSLRYQRNVIKYSSIFPDGLVPEQIVTQTGFWCKSLLFFATVPARRPVRHQIARSSRPACPKAASARSNWARLCSDVTVILMRLVSFGTVGGRMAGA